MQLNEKIKFENIDENNFETSWVPFLRDNYSRLNDQLILIRWPHGECGVGQPEFVDTIDGDNCQVARRALEAIHGKKLGTARGYQIIANPLLGDWVSGYLSEEVSGD